MSKKGEYKELHKPTKKGYLRFRKNEKGNFQMEHRYVWEKHFGKIPEGMQIHHKDFDKTNNDITNLLLVTPLEHKRLHEGCKYIDGIWYKPCKICGEYKPCTEEYWYFSRGWISGRTCKKCYIKNSLEARAMRIARGWKRKNYPRKDKSLQPYN